MDAWRFVPMPKKLDPIAPSSIKKDIQNEPKKKNKVLLEPIKAPTIQSNIVPAPIARNPPSIKSDVKRIGIKQLLETIQPLIEPGNEPSTPLILDPSQRVDVFYQYSNGGAVFIEAKKYVIETMITKKLSLTDALEDMRRLLVLAMKEGRPLVIRMTDSAADFKLQFVREECFPAQVFQNAGLKFYQQDFFSKVVRPQDMPDGVWVTKPGFYVIVTSLFDAAMYKMYLEKSLPLAYMTPISIESPSGPAATFAP
jgi:hypothetical protein